MKAVRKALVAGGVAAAATLGAGLSDGNFTLAELLVALGAGLAGFAATWKVSNEDA
jgi:hypothetical protein